MSGGLQYARLIRLPNVFTACADVSIGILVSQLNNALSIGLLAISACLYCAGMAWNDYFDRHVDAIERPQRPIPSGSIRPATAFWLGLTLCAIGVGFACLLNALTLIISVALVGMILAYDAGLKSTPFGPFAMGGCRFLNVLLGFTLTHSIVDWPTQIAIASIVGGYVVGITLFARHEARGSSSENLCLALAIGGCAILGAAMIPARTLSLHPYLCAVLAIALAPRARAAVVLPNPENMQRFVKAAIFGLVLLDSALAIAVAGPIGLAVILWLIPAIQIGQWVYST